MPYLYATERPNYSDLASGRVFYSLSGHPAFPIRLASEIFQRCLAVRASAGLEGRCVLYDPCCGAGYLISVVSYLHWPHIRVALGSDINAEAASLAERNLGLLHAAGMQRRRTEISEMVRQFGKESHREAYQSCLVMNEHVSQMAEDFPLTTSAFQADVFDGKALIEHLAGVQADIVLTDIPYGLHSAWQGGYRAEPVWGMLDSLRNVLALGGMVAVASDKHQKIAHEAYQRLEYFQVGKRKVTLLKPV